ncbi:hypothetical protein SELMODRAFT_448641 [Selaginella moellendorffii]|uniref:Uncharacterized protein n=1 Tax=Selaginella moellendorffii TaxID=88036 RepID=D8T8T6_SELML|nr:hypothetical protein SELMODRAFT_448641 [Selaginella moellendorffii]
MSSELQASTIKWPRTTDDLDNATLLHTFEQRLTAALISQEIVQSYWLHHSSSSPPLDLDSHRAMCQVHCVLIIVLYHSTVCHASSLLSPDARSRLSQATVNNKGITDASTLRLLMFNLDGYLAIIKKFIGMVTAQRTGPTNHRRVTMLRLLLPRTGQTLASGGNCRVSSRLASQPDRRHIPIAAPSSNYYNDKPKMVTVLLSQLQDCEEIRQQGYRLLQRPWLIYPPAVVFQPGLERAFCQLKSRFLVFLTWISATSPLIAARIRSTSICRKSTRTSGICLLWANAFQKKTFPSSILWRTPQASAARPHFPYISMTKFARNL